MWAVSVQFSGLYSSAQPANCCQTVAQFITKFP